MRQDMVVGWLLGVVLGAGAAPVQAAGPAKMNATIPFEFTAGNKEFRKGNCAFDMTMANKVSIKCSRASTVVQARDLPYLGSVFKDPPRHDMIFKRYGKEYFLSEVWIGFEGMELAKSEAEEELESNGVTASSIKLTVKQ